jgi:hypothetical protein
MSIAELVDNAILKEAQEKEGRSYMGGSILGTECDRQLWYSYKRPWKVDSARVQRIFDMGNIIEDYVVELLKKAGITVYDKDENGKQFGFVDGKIAGHTDGVLMGLPESELPHLFECKSANDKNYKLFQKDGVEKTNNKYYVQCQVYMQKLNLSKCLFVVLNKNTQELHFETIDYKKDVADVYLSRGKDIAEMENEPDRKYSSSKFFKCRFCNYNKECWEE